MVNSQLKKIRAGAMENWGLVTFRDSYVLNDSQKLSITGMDVAVASVIIHELAHQVGIL